LIRDGTIFPPFECEPKKEGRKDVHITIQIRYSEILASCYQQYLKGQRCKYEDDEEWRYNCSNCPENNSSRFCKANLALKKLIRLLAESLVAEDLLNLPDVVAELQEKRVFITEESIKSAP
jgi:hypothetical protein